MKGLRLNTGGPKTYIPVRQAKSGTFINHRNRAPKCLNASALTSFETHATALEVFMPESVPAHTPSFNNSIIELNAGNFEEFLVREGPNSIVMVDFYTETCGPCKLMLPHFEKLPSVFKKMKFAKFNCGLEEHRALATRHRIRSLPTFKLYRGGRLIDEMTGGRPVQLRQMLLHWSR
ncbi:hypothetical protein CEUSTIGMA_g4038.t1 [Chlamydomonas eustigma]|uniref:Thioredoxin domain-containing protein n=1 Tax=Chlamydomonas eustigma TaxID=1157962 RepID=A0A250X129_9CHLO|nr:hypothetical protein CEUSTIGMA_g4038.t1 [Chlamydomonas eustigma]|eukprot:GAX76592.1 hypothetical protein CEUSTIGMA_g4038.t1 [Chlamydomonas eustigma]